MMMQNYVVQNITIFLSTKKSTLPKKSAFKIIYKPLCVFFFFYSQTKIDWRRSKMTKDIKGVVHLKKNNFC